jgi:chromosome partitioning protein
LREAAPQIKSIRLPTHEDVLAQMPAIVKNFDYVVADGPAGLSEVTRALMFMADLAIFPCGPSALDLRAVVEAVKVLAAIRQVRKGKPEAIIIPNKLQAQYRLSKELMQLVRNFEMPAGNGLHLRQAYADAAGQGTVVWRMKTSSAREATAEMQYLFQELTSYESTPQNTRSSLAHA